MLLEGMLLMTMVLIVEKDAIDEDDAVDSELRQLLSETAYCVCVCVCGLRDVEKLMPKVWMHRVLVSRTAL